MGGLYNQLSKPTQPSTVSGMELSTGQGDALRLENAGMTHSASD